MVNGRVAAALRHEGERIGFFAEEPVGVEGIGAVPQQMVAMQGIDRQHDRVTGQNLSPAKAVGHLRRARQKGGGGIKPQRLAEDGAGQGQRVADDRAHVDLARADQPGA